MLKLTYSNLEFQNFPGEGRGREGRRGRGKGREGGRGRIGKGGEDGKGQGREGGDGKGGERRGSRHGLRPLETSSGSAPERRQA